MNQKFYHITPEEGIHPQISMFLKMLDDGTREWTDYLEDISEDAIVWQPYPDAHSIGAVMLHIANVEASWIQRIILGQERDPEELKTLMSEETDFNGEKWPTPPRKSLSWYFEQLQKVRDKTHKLVRDFEEPEKVVTYVDTDFTINWILHHVVTHEAYHGGQINLLAIQYKNLNT